MVSPGHYISPTLQGNPVGQSHAGPGLCLVPASIATALHFSVTQEALIKNTVGQAQWLMPVIPALREVGAGGLQGQETSLTNLVKPRLY